jgi:hypothetical protein
MRYTRPVLAIALLLAAQSAVAQAPRRPFLFKDARSELIAARVRGDKDVTLVIASMPAANARVVRSIAAAGGSVQFRDDDVDYLRARVPLDKVEALALDPAVHSINISTRPNPAGGGGGGGGAEQTVIAYDSLKKRVWPPPLSAFPVANRYDPLGDLRALDFRRANPTFDGRGVTLALIDMSLDPLLPELQTAVTLDGKPAPKIVGYETVLDPEEEEDGRWLRMKDTVSAVDGRIRYRDRTYTAPRAGNFRIEVLNELKFDSLARAGINRDINRDGNPKGASNDFAVLWDDRTDDVWVDTDQDGNFANEKALTDFSVRPEFGVFGKDNPRTSVRESIGFGLQIDKAKKMVGLNLGVASHASLIVGAAVASKGAAGKFDGVAPGSQLVNVAEGGHAYGQTEAVIRAVKNSKVDGVWLEQSSGITRPYTLRDGRLVTTVIYERLIQKYKKPIMIPTHNYPVLGGTDDFVMAAGAIGVGGHEGKDNFFVNHGVRVKHDDNLLITGGYGPMGNGAFGPDIISPSNYISTSRGFEETGGVMAGLYRLPPGYRIAGGTSTATPTAAAAVALLISGAKQTGIKHDAFRIKHAITSSARYVPHLPAYKQGSGVINVGAAWEVLQALDKVPVPAQVTITSKAPVKHVFSNMLATPDEGVGLYEREGWKAGDRAERTVTFTRTSGPREPMTFQLNFIGDDGKTFSAPATVTLPLNKPVPVSIAIAPKTAGAHTALLTLNHSSIPGHAHRMLTAVVAGEQLNAANNYTVETKTEVPRPEMRSFFYTVPAGVNALRVDVEGSTREVQVAVVRPDTRTANAVRTVAGAGGRGGAAGGGGGGGRGGGAGRATYIVSDPMPGVWEVRLTDIADVSNFDHMQAEKDEPAPPTPATLRVSALAADIVLPQATADLALKSSGNSTFDVSISNRMAAFTGATANVALGSARRERPTLREKQQQEYEIDVPAGSTQLIVKAANATDAKADLDVFVFDCTGRTGCSRNGQTDSDPNGDEIVTIQNPAAGKWKVVIDAASVPSGSTAFDYLDVVFNPSYGMVSSADVPKERKVGEQWSTQAHTWFANALPAGRVPFQALLLQGQLSGNVPFSINLMELTAPRAGVSSQQQQR